MSKKTYLAKMAFCLIVFALIGCNNSNNNTATSANERKENEVSTGVKVESNLSEKNVSSSTGVMRNAAEEYSCEECVSLVNRIVTTSEYNDFFKKKYDKKYSISINEATKQKVSIQVLIHGNVPMGWLEFDLEAGTLKDVTNDPLQPIRLNVNKSLVREFKDNCLKCCLD